VAASGPLPEFLAGAFDADALVRDGSTIVVLDPDGKILWTNPAWERFARENGGHDLERFASYYAGIGPVLRGFYESAFANALLTGAVYVQEYECSSPDVFRKFHLQAMPVAGKGLLLTHSLLVERPHEHQQAPAAAAPPDRYRGANGIVVQCSNCRRVRRAGEEVWDWVRDWVAASPPNTSHGICAPCLGFYWGQ
jgi:hypothetical protein